MRRLLVMVDEAAELEPALDVEGTAEVWTELETEDALEVDVTLELEGTAEVWIELETEDVLELGVTLELEGTTEVMCELEDEVWELDETVDFTLVTEDVLELTDELGIDDVEETTDEELELGFVLVAKLETDVILLESELDD